MPKVWCLNALHHTGSPHPAHTAPLTLRGLTDSQAPTRTFYQRGKKGKTNPHLKAMEESSTQFMKKVQKNLPYNSWYTVFMQTQVLFQRVQKNTSPKPNISVHSSGPQPRGTWKYTPHFREIPWSFRITERRKKKAQINTSTRRVDGDRKRPGTAEAVWGEARSGGFWG